MVDEGLEQCSSESAAKEKKDNGKIPALGKRSYTLTNSMALKMEHLASSPYSAKAGISAFIVPNRGNHKACPSLSRTVPNTYAFIICPDSCSSHVHDAHYKFAFVQTAWMNQNSTDVSIVFAVRVNFPLGLMYLVVLLWARKDTFTLLS